jgi:hypothetical protein
MTSVDHNDIFIEKKDNETIYWIFRRSEEDVKNGNKSEGKLEILYIEKDNKKVLDFRRIDVKSIDNLEYFGNLRDHLEFLRR